MVATIIIAPAENAKNNGRTGATYIENTQAKQAKTGSTMPDITPAKKDLPAFIPSRKSGSETLVPSGIFCIPMPTASIIAGTKREKFPRIATLPKATPIAIPSGMLCKVIEVASKIFRLFIASFPPFLLESFLSKYKPDRIIKTPPKINPPTTKKLFLIWKSPQNSSAGKIKLKKEDAIITPPAKDSIADIYFGLIFLQKRTKLAPKLVQSQQNELTISVTKIIGNPASQSIIECKTPYNHIMKKRIFC